jgi:hypothetical protein
MALAVFTSTEVERAGADWLRRHGVARGALAAAEADQKAMS